ncbi:type 1 periplasmic-binding domain-containing protein [Chitinophaga pinensis]|uniref:Uncharacterized protein n=1 Tax=Chitinophaga pinensis (strain ATCC 43595 / DSM 2588 / LMG 13176 / NBRC 15968 / NCIMB 11800 / UQM 2034) TaxID=485918 RepID=A0A979FZT2_CHIPD|nr:hypothetical protein [Chitinophaga pinensis]ACU58230.1 hypothetical protein Cpin_0732 [Chitinophaga pinensis DSM 2588]
MRAFLLAIIAVLFVLPTFSQIRHNAGYLLESVEDKLDSAKNYQKILIVAEGNMQVRMYSQNLAKELAKYFKDQKIECKYEFLGDPARTDVNVALEQAKAWKPDAIMRMKPTVSEEKAVRQPKGFTNADNTRNLFGQRNVLVNVFDITLTDAVELVWSAKLSAAYEGADEGIYYRVARGIIVDLKKQNVVGGKLRFNMLDLTTPKSSKAPIL